MPVPAAEMEKLKREEEPATNPKLIAVKNAAEALRRDARPTTFNALFKAIKAADEKNEMLKYIQKALTDSKARDNTPEDVLKDIKWAMFYILLAASNITNPLGENNRVKMADRPEGGDKDSNIEATQLAQAYLTAPAEGARRKLTKKPARKTARKTAKKRRRAFSSKQLSHARDLNNTAGTPTAEPSRPRQTPRRA